jgi:metal transporter CNNM
MYGLFPVAFPIAKILDLLLGCNHGVVFNRLGLKTLIALHERLHHLPNERLTTEEISVMASILDMNEVEVSTIMTPSAKIFSLSSDTFLNDTTRYNILNSGYSNIPIHLHTQPNTFIGVLPVKSLVSMNFKEEITIGQITLESLPTVYAVESCHQLLHVFRDRKTQMVLVIEQGTVLPLGIVTARDLLNVVIGE